MGKKYLDTKKGSLEQSVLGVWKTAVEEGSGRVDDRTSEHRKKLESVRARREPTKIGEAVELEEATGKEIAAKMIKDKSMKAFASKVAKMKTVSRDDLEKMLPDYVAGAAITKLFEEVATEAYEIGTDEYRKYMERLTPGETIEEKTGDKEAYQKFFNSALKKFGVKSPAELKGDKKKEFYDYIDKNWTADHEEAFEFAKEAKVASILDTVKNMWRMNEKTKKEDDDKEITGGKTLTGKKSASVEIDPDIEEKQHKKKVHSSKTY